ncbi:PTS sugar transporter subunit IIB [Vibrio sp. JC009]|uniref:PTS sugar transporter subunit IIB n=1 Tax=Vibrio sp. JC009 TaxID=2912314 RepID=UPI0023B05E03|nr:PTS sugar transporter subunit IIB [Vibrio sp. JC009]WED23445.1 PTS sugar transporter subunit IIB [Vibrio sp. JC009]
MINVLCVCSVGVGSSLMLKMNAEKIFTSHGVKVKAENTNVSGAGGLKPDVLITTPDIFPQIRNCDAKQTIIMDNMVSKKELGEKISSIIDQFK